LTVLALYKLKAELITSASIILWIMPCDWSVVCLVTRQRKWLQRDVDGVTSQDVHPPYHVGVSESQPLSAVCLSLITIIIVRFLLSSLLHSVLITDHGHDAFGWHKMPHCQPSSMSDDLTLWSYRLSSHVLHGLQYV